MTQPRFSPDYPASVVGGELRLPKPPGVFRRFWARHPWVTDSLIAAVYFVPTFLGMLTFGLSNASPQLPASVLSIRLVAIALMAVALVLFRRRNPWLLISAMWFVCLTVYPMGSTDALPILLALYALAVYRSVKAAWLGFGFSVVVATASSYVAVALNKGGVLSPFVADAPASSSQFAVLMLIATLIGVTMGNRRRYLVALIDRAQDLARERDQQGELAAARERARIAREIHDIVAHSLTVMVTLADGSAATAQRDPERAADAMRRAAETGRDALGDMRRMLGLLSDPQSTITALTPQPGLHALPDLVDGFRAMGMPLTLRTTGTPIVDAHLELTIYRVAQEALTNAFRYAATAQAVRVELSFSPDSVELTICDDAPRSSSSSLGGGHGIIGMRERVALFGGRFEAGPRDGLGWKVRAEFSTAALSSTTKAEL